MDQVKQYKYTALYIACIVLVNWAFTVVQPVLLPGGDFWHPIALVVGLIFVVRDFAQREIGHRVLAAMLIGGLLSYFMANPFVAVASVVAFLVSELADWAVYSFTKRPFAQRVLLSSALGTPIDSIVFLEMIDSLSVINVVAMIVSKMVGALVVWYLIQRRPPAPAAGQ